MLIRDLKKLSLMKSLQNSKYYYESDKELLENLPDLEIENLALEIDLKRFDE